jgi:hypothetical protein
MSLLHYNLRRFGKDVRIVALVIWLGTAAWCQLARVAVQDPASGAANGEQAGESTLVIESESPLPETFPQAKYEFRFRARGGVPTLHWRVEKGTLPPGFKLDDDGLLHGQTERPGEFRVTISVRDGSRPQQAVQKEFVLRVLSGLTLAWKNAAHVSGSRIEGSAEVSNATPDDMDLTFIVMAVPGNGRAVAIGYQHFVLRRGTVAKELPFGENLPNGGYVVHVDAVGDVPGKKLIYRERMQTPSMLQVTVGP